MPMLISRRRLKWIIFTLLVLSFVLLVRPMRSWIDQAIARNALASNFSVDEIRWHLNKSVMEAKELSWNGDVTDGSFGFSADRGWFAFEPMGLVDRKFHSPVAVLENARLYLDINRREPRPASTLWSQFVNDLLEQLDWPRVRAGMKSLSATRDLTSTWNKRIDRWLQRSHEIVTLSSQLQDEAISMDNPLRQHDLMQRNMNALRELAAEQQTLIGQFEQVEKLLQSETRRVADLAAQDCTQITAIASGARSSQDREARVQEVCVDLATEAAYELWQQFAPFAEIADRLQSLTADGSTNPHNVNVRVRRDPVTVFKFAELKASGIFSCDQEITPFKSLGHWSLTQAQDLQLHRQLDWTSTFTPRGLLVEVTVGFDSRVGRAAEIQLKARAAQAVGSEPEAAEALPKPVWLEADLASLDGQVQGAMVLQAHCLPSLSYLRDTSHSAGRLAAIVGGKTTAVEDNSSNDSCESAEGCAVDLEITGSWSSPQIHLKGELPAWMQEFVQHEIETELAHVTLQAQNQFSEEFELLLGQLENLTSHAIHQAKVTAQTHQQELLAIQARVQQQIEESSKAAGFSRRSLTLQR